jgi:cysteine-rich repeat protein
MWLPHSTMRLRSTLTLCLLFEACLSPPSYEGRFCDPDGTCPPGLMCGIDQRCRRGEPEADAASPSPGDAEVSIAALSMDALSQDGRSIDSSTSIDAEPADTANTPDAEPAIDGGASDTGARDVGFAMDAAQSPIDASADAGARDSGPQPVCGNRVVEQGEQCDDGNTEPFDGCDSCFLSLVVFHFSGRWSCPGAQFCTTGVTVDSGVLPVAIQENDAFNGTVFFTPLYDFYVDQMNGHRLYHFSQSRTISITTNGFTFSSPSTGDFTIEVANGDPMSGDTVIFLSPGGAPFDNGAGTQVGVGTLGFGFQDVTGAAIGTLRLPTAPPTPARFPTFHGISVMGGIPDKDTCGMMSPPHCFTLWGTIDAVTY